MSDVQVFTREDVLQGKTREFIPTVRPTYEPQKRFTLRPDIQPFVFNNVPQPGTFEAELWAQTENMPDPEEERARLDVAMAFANSTDIDFKTAYNNVDALIDVMATGKGYKIGQEYTRMKYSQAREYLSDNWQIGTATTRRGEVGYEILEQGFSDEKLSSVEEIDQQIIELRKNTTENPFVWMIGRAAEIAPFMLEGMKKGAQKGAALAGSFAATAAIAGQAGPQVALPEEVVTVPGAALLGFKAGMAWGQSETSFKVIAGNSFLNLTNDGVDPGIARWAALAEGFFSALVETVQVSQILNTIPGADKVFQSGIGKAIKKASEKVTSSQIGQAAIRYGANVATETGEEIVQEIVSIAAEDLSKRVNNAVHGTEFESAWEGAGQQILEVAKSSVAGLSVLGLPGLAGNVMNIRPNVRETQNRETTERVYKDVEETITPQQREEVNAALGMDVYEEIRTLEAERDNLPQENPQEYTVSLIQKQREIDFLKDRKFQEEIKRNPPAWMSTSAEWNAKIEQRIAERGEIVFSDQFKQKIADNAPQLNEQEIESVALLTDLFSDYVGVTRDQFLTQAFGPQIFADREATGQVLTQGKRGATQILEDGKALIHASKQTDFSTMVHEMGHVFRRWLRPEEQQTFETWLGIEDGKWTRENEETFAKHLERYLQQGYAPNEELRSAFQQIADFIRRVFMYIGERWNLTPEAIEGYNRIFTPREGQAERQQAQGEEVFFQQAPPTDSEAFREWFGDSKVVDENGNPLVVYHGSYDNFQEFNTGIDFGDLGSHFTVSPEVAGENFAKRAEGRVYPVYLRIENPIEVEDPGAFNVVNYTLDDPTTFAKELISKKIATKKDIADITKAVSEAEPRDKLPLENKLTKELIERKGYDGIVYYNKGEMPTGFSSSVEQEKAGLSPKKTYSSAELIEAGVPVTKTYVAFSPEQIKSVYNKGTFDPDNPNILYQAAAWHGSPHQFDRFTVEKIGTGEGAQAFGWGLYFTEKEEIARHYASILSTIRNQVIRLGGNKGSISRERLYPELIQIVNDFINTGNQDVALNLLNIEKAKHEAYKKRAETWQEEGRVTKEEAQRNIRQYEENLSFVNVFIDQVENYPNDLYITSSDGRNLYKVTLHKGKDPSEYVWLDWYETVKTEDAKKIITYLTESPKTEAQRIDQEIISDETFSVSMDDLKDSLASETGESFYRLLSMAIGHPKDASKILLASGIDGIRYPAGSLSGGKGDANNYVVFDENAVTIEEHILYKDFSHMEEVRRAVEAGLPVPENVLQEYNSEDWARQEIMNRSLFAEEATTFPNVEEYISYAMSMDPEGKPRTYWEAIYTQSKWRVENDPVSRKAGNDRFIKSLTKPALVMYLMEAAKQQALSGFHGIIQSGAKAAIKKGDITDEHYKKIMDQIRSNPALYREEFAILMEDRDEIERLNREREADPTAAEIEELQQRLQTAREEAKAAKEKLSGYQDRIDSLDSRLRWAERDLEKKQAELDKTTEKLNVRWLKAESDKERGVTREAGNNKFVDSLSKEKLITYLIELENKPEIAKSITGFLKTGFQRISKQRKNNTPADINDRHYKSIIGQIKNDTAYYREIFSNLIDDQTEINALRSEEEADPHTAEIESILHGQKQAVKEAKAQVRETQRRRKEAKEMTEYFHKLVRQIMKPPSAAIHRDYDRQIKEIQAGLALKGPRSQEYQNRQKLQQFLKEDPDADWKPEVIAEANKTSVYDISIEELEEIYDTVENFRERGRHERDLEMLDEERWVNQQIYAIFDTVSGGYPPFDKNVGSVQEREGRETAAVKKGMYLFTRPHQMMTILGGRRVGELIVNLKKAKAEYKKNRTKENEKKLSQAKKSLRDYKGGVFKTLLVDYVNDSYDSELVELNARYEKAEYTLKSLGIAPKDLGQQMPVGNYDFTVNDVIHMWIAMQDPDSAATLVNGNNINQETIENLISRLDDKYIQWGQYMLDEFSGENFERLNKVMRKIDNREMVKVEKYFPIRRESDDIDSFSEEMATEILDRHALKKAYPGKKFSITRTHSEGAAEIPMRLGATNLFFDQLQKQEKYISSAQMAKRLHRVFGNSDVKRAIRQEHGEWVNKWIEKYINSVIDPNIYKINDTLHHTSRILRSHAALSYLGFNFLTPLKQLPSLAFYLADAGPFQIVKSVSEFMFNRKETVRFVDEADPQVKYRSFDRITEELKLQGKGAYDRFVQKVGKAGMWMIQFMDRQAVLIGWKAVYNKGIADGLTHEEAVRKAKDATLQTQPQAAAKDLPQAYRTNEILNWFLMFSNQLNQIFNMITRTVPNDLKQRKWGHAVGTITGVVISALMIGMLSKRRIPDEPEEFYEDIRDQLFSAVPIVGGNIKAGRDGFWGMGVDVAPVAGEAGAVIAMFENMAREESELELETILRFTEAAMVTGGLPTAQPRRIIKSIIEENWWNLIGGEWGEE